MFSPVPSHTWPSMFSRMASSKPEASASVLAKMEFKYRPLSLNRTGTIVSSIRLKEATQQLMAPSESM